MPSRIRDVSQSPPGECFCSDDYWHSVDAWRAANFNQVIAITDRPVARGSWGF